METVLGLSVEMIETSETGLFIYSTSLYYTSLARRLLGCAQGISML